MLKALVSGDNCFRQDPNSLQTRRLRDGLIQRRRPSQIRSSIRLPFERLHTRGALSAAALA